MKKSFTKADNLLPLIMLVCAALFIITGCGKSDTAGTSKAKPGAALESGSAQQAEPSKVLAEVNGRKFTQADADKEISGKLASLLGQVPEAQLVQIREKMLKESVDDFVSRTLLLGAADQAKITVSEAEIKTAIDRIKNNLPQGVTMEEALKRSGITQEKLHEEVALGLRLTKIIEAQVKDKKAPTDKEIRDYYDSNKKQFEVPETVHARHILVKTEEKDDKKTKDEKKAKAENIRKQLTGGADFARIAKTSSDCPSKKEGGDLGTVQRGQMVKPFEDAAFKQEVKAIGPIVETPFGYHIIQVLEHSQPKEKSLDEVKGTIEKTIQQQRLQETAERYLAELKAKAKIVYADGMAPAAKK
ncbi:MAG: peptidylprolyl isomerase [Proteobacteria bacterium]|nr:peptidylprolyl isomerase [Pseudomonadota bacterium]